MQNTVIQDQGKKIKLCNGHVTRRLCVDIKRCVCIHQKHYTAINTHAKESTIKSSFPLIRLLLLLYSYESNAGTFVIGRRINFSRALAMNSLRVMRDVVFIQMELARVLESIQTTKTTRRSTSTKKEHRQWKMTLTNWLISFRLNVIKLESMKFSTIINLRELFPRMDFLFFLNQSIHTHLWSLPFVSVEGLLSRTSTIKRWLEIYAVVRGVKGPKSRKVFKNWKTNSTNQKSAKSMAKRVIVNMIYTWIQSSPSGTRFVSLLPRKLYKQ